MMKNKFQNSGCKKFVNFFVSITQGQAWDTKLQTGNTKGGHSTIDLLFDWFGTSCMTTDKFCFYLQNRLIQTSQTGGQSWSDTPSFSIPCFKLK
jgi:hypothetical protein